MNLYFLPFQANPNFDFINPFEYMHANCDVYRS